MTAVSIRAWWDSLFATLISKHPHLAFLLNIAKGVGDREIPTVIGQLPAGMTGAQALFDWLIGQLIAKVTDPIAVIALQVVKGLIDAWLGSLTLPTP